VIGKTSSNGTIGCHKGRRERAKREARSVKLSRRRRRRRRRRRKEEAIGDIVVDRESWGSQRDRGLAESAR
jgi:hypothetical protein